MATSGQVIERFAEMSGFRPATVDRMLRPLRDAGMVPMGDAGRGQRRGHYEPSHLANVILAFAGPQPSDAARAAQLLRPLRYIHSNPPSPSLRPYRWEHDLGSIFDSVIREQAFDKDGELAKLNWPTTTEITLCLNPLGACFAFSADEGDSVNSWMDWYGPAPTPNAAPPPVVRVRRLTTIWFDMLCVAGELWRDTWEHQRKQTLNSVPVVPARAIPDDETAASLPGEAAALGDRHVDNAPRGQQPHYGDKREKPQSSSQSACLSLHQHVRSDPYDEPGNGGADSAAA